ncbi:MAG: Lpg1974 family pore-forming outer membrane protein [Planctomycetia bacterium]
MRGTVHRLSDAGRRLVLMLAAVALPAVVVADDAIEAVVMPDDAACPPSTGMLPTGDCTPRFVAGADYLLLRPSFSNSTAMYQATAVGGQSIALSPLNYDFGYASGVRGFIGYNFSDDTLGRFSYLGIDAATSVVGTASGNYVGGNGTAYIGPFYTEAIPATASISSTSNVSLDLYDLELARRFEIDTETDGAARWDTAGSAGIRFMDSSVSTMVDNYCPLCPNYLVTTNRVFQGVGPRLAIQGRRYLGAARRWSAFATGGAALLVGSYSNDATRFTKVVNLLETQSTGGTLVVPNFDIALGTSWQWGPRTSISAGWMLMFFGNLGYSETIDTNGINAGAVATSVPLTNSSLAYDGAFFRLTHSF